jgi:pimeloyl-ACP methyl ester carboxylesterase
MTPLDAALLPVGIRARFVAGINGLTMHMLEAGFETPGRPCLLLLHGFPELAYSWRKVMRWPRRATMSSPPISAATGARSDGMPITTAIWPRRA